MNNLILLVTEQDTWTISEGENEGTPFILRFRPQLKDFIATGRFNERLTIIWLYQSDDRSLMPSDEDADKMKAMEDALVEAMELDLQAVLAFVYTGQDQKEWHWYSTDIQESGKRINEALAAFDKLPIELSFEVDPEWTEYNSVLSGAEAGAAESESDNG